ncbi:Flp pilus assembly protein CpaB [Pontixanthobacter aestiaquae]|uniref:Flp pilus assembly protein CpaB n=1 Tax=Pontixanthobacter aestiaquae TaxID=1509367 RepID=A0A844Z604_9SPHN|nr:Flp pilus assembly protein CpaB [Pontixanthobacter aestiaquae]MDN3646074.1 Flp pilus assembly protein CpaB [Pontixanthobacter aestiaquae]MXO82934.1 Flp pilus assembly protein CpaB [Pontixanthobacter aestiaquae]
MDRKKLVLLLGALIIAIGTALAARSMFAGASAPEAQAAPEPQGPKVLVAQRGLAVGTIITADSISYQMWPEELLQDAYFIDGESDVTQLLGTVVRHQITAGEPVTQGSLVKPGDRGFLAAALGPGMRAVTVPVSAKTGVGGFVFPGDRVDLVLTQTVKGGEGEPLQASETILRNLRVLATDQSTTQETTESGKTVVRAFRTVTLEVTPRIAEKVAVSQTIGTLSLSLRSIADNQGELEQAIASGDVKVPDDATPEEEEALLRKAMARPNDKATTFVTGGDVSRFQRSSVPKKADNTPPAPPRMGVPAGANTGPVNRGPSVRVTRGKNTTEVPVGNGRAVSSNAGAMVEQTQQSISSNASGIPVAGGMVQ